MFKLLVVLALVAAIQGQLPGGFTNRPELVDQESTGALVRLAVQELKDQQNLFVSPVKVLTVGTQVVAGMNYHIVFTARSFSTAGVLTCTARVYQHFTGVQTVSSVACDSKF
ncbi:unnamed protein product [Adineta steineri]|uniref:Cystatin domain-containing protein n=1 Tax=Adineta steineri TaxID=433720 RepID=A0A814U5U9_9BILA|nr:unnamed protein product [Adineta steineri]CAF0827400.1 unnamed protein product [Adineta steineri]CAF0862381.1 unnamed protein product [Adineta steineri]CAF1074431.1 unnamed protein product [Adineta steineri]CAF1170262.1 unnamed protein product [Adineta steineri]